MAAKNYNEYMRQYMLARYHERRKQAVEKLGALCVDCGTSEELEFDHADASTKEFNISKIWSYKQERFESELSKCVLRCHSCHVEKSRQSDWRIVGHGEGVSGKKNCKCEPCRKRKAEYMKNYKSRPSNSIG